MTAVSRAFYWQRLIDAGVVKSGAEIARREKLHPWTVNELLRLTLLAPEIIQQILAGQQPRTLSLLRFTDSALLQDCNAQVAVLREFDA